MNRRWNEALDELESWIDRALRVEATDEDDVPAVTPWSATEDLGPLPPEVAARAAAVLARVQDAERELSARRDTTRAELEGRRARTRVAAPTSPPAASLIDRIA